MEDLEMGLYRIFQTIKEKRLNIIFDTSGSMYHYMDVGKTSILKLVNYLSHSSNDSHFNVISFSKLNASFSESVVPCSKQNLFLLTGWLKNLKCETQTNSLLALVSAFSDDNCDGVVVFTDGLPSQKTTVVLKCVEEISDGRPVHVIYINDGFNNRNVVSFWENLTERTYGTFHVIQHTKQDEKFDVVSGGRFDIRSQTSSNGSANVGYSCPKNNHKLSSRSKLTNGWNKHTEENVLAKCDDDGLYYKGKIIEEVQN